MRIRLATEYDLKDLTEIYNQAIVRGTCNAFTETFEVEDRRDWFESHQNKQYPLYVYEKDERAVGFVYFTAYRPGRLAMQGTAEISYYIHQDFQGMGIGSQLMEFGLERAEGLGFDTLIAILLSVNEGSFALLKKFDFAEWGRLLGAVQLPLGRCDHLYYGRKIGKDESE
ncbi:GNAT family N-acetyltransferase [Gottschalkiaceae bacterium SANA]|nr:GNAT family N-acetyltransferase [Gottschalkiaceae bacterium SANA]